MRNEGQNGDGWPTWIVVVITVLASVFLMIEW